MKFAHLADCHIGSFRDPKLRDLSTQAFVAAMELCRTNAVDFILISGDLFNTAVPAVERLKTVVEELRITREAGIRVYTVAGSHDFSPNGKTMLDVLESAGLCTNVVKGTVTDGRLRLRFSADPSGAKITGMVGRRGMLERTYYDDLDRAALEAEDGFKIFMFHTALTELKSTELASMDSAPVSLLPKGFDYYAGGHVHERLQSSMPGYRQIVYPGPLFPNSFSELEKLGGGGFYLYEDGRLTYVPVQLHNVYPISVSGNSAEEIMHALKSEIESHEFYNTIVTLRVAGTCAAGSISDIDLRSVIATLYQRGAYFVMRNTAALSTAGFEEVKVREESIPDLERSIIREHAGKSELWTAEDEARIIDVLMTACNLDKNEGERSADFERRLVSATDHAVGF
jgi:DNA repair protein SbcD/Mre11